MTLTLQIARHIAHCCRATAGTALFIWIGLTACHWESPSSGPANVSERSVTTSHSANGFLGWPLPGVPSLDADLLGKLRAAWEARQPGYKPRTQYLNSDGSPRYTNRLFLESSPYLLPHAHNPGIHYLQEDQPEAVGNAIVQWLEKTG